MKLFSAADVARLLDMRECIELMAATQRALSAGNISIPLRTSLPLSAGDSGADSALLLMPGQLGGLFGAKLLSLYPGNTARGLPSIQGSVLLFEAAHGAPVALLDAASITAIRTAAASGMATRALAREDARVLALLGYGVQAASHLEAMRCVRNIEQVRVWGPDPARTAAFAARHSGHGLAVTPAANPKAALADADVVCAVSRANEPIIRNEWLQPGVHINLVGAHTADAREADSAVIAGAAVFTEITEFALAESGDLLLAIADGAISADAIRGEIGDLLAGRIRGRQAPQQNTIYVSLGNIAQDLAAAGHVYRQSLTTDH